MKRAARIIVLITIGLFIGVQSFGQFFIKGGAGYGLGVQKLIMGEAYTSTTTENIYGSFGGNWGFYLGGGMELNKFIDFEVDLGYQNGRSVTVPNTFLSRTFTGRLIYFTPSLSFKTAIDENISPYAKFGLLTGLPLTKVNVSDEDKRFSGGFPLGVTEAIGLNFNATDNLKFFVELTHQSMIYKPTKRREADDIIVKFKDKLPYPEPSNQEITHHFFSFGAVGLNLGIKIVI